MEEIFFFQYHLRMGYSECMTLPVYERKWLVHRFIEQKEKEAKAMESAKKEKTMILRGNTIMNIHEYFSEDPNFDVHMPQNNKSSACLLIQKTFGQTGNLAEFQDAMGNVLCYIDSNGVFHGELANDDALGKPTKDYYDQLFFLCYHMGLSVQDAIKLGQQGRDIFVARYLEQKIAKESAVKDKFPRNDKMSAHYGTIKNCNFDFFYNHQFVLNEKTTESTGGANESWFILEHRKILKGSLTGTVYRNNTAIQTFVISEAGDSTLTPVGNPTIFAEKIKLDVDAGEIGVFWNDLVPGPHHLVVSYEFSN